MGGDIPEKPRLCASLVTFSPSGCGCALPRWELWSLLGRFAGIGRVVLSREDENGAYAWNQEGGNVAPVGVVAWLYAWKLWVRGLVVSCVGVGSVKALRDSVTGFVGVLRGGGFCLLPKDSEKSRVFSKSYARLA